MVPEFTFDPALGEADGEAFDLKSNPRYQRDWQVKKDAEKKEYDLNVAQWAATEGRFRKHFFKLKPEEEKVSLEEMLLRLTQNDVVHRRYLDPEHRSFVPLKGVYVDVVDVAGKRKKDGNLPSPGSFYGREKKKLAKTAIPHGHYQQRL